MDRRDDMNYIKKIIWIAILFFIGKSVYAEGYYVDSSWEFASYAKISDGVANLYASDSADKKNYVVALSAGHGCESGSSEYVYCHPDKSPKIVSGSTSSGSLYCTASSFGMVFLNGENEADVNLKVASLLKSKLLDNGFDVLMLREDNVSRLDNIARVVLANNLAAIHLSIHFDSTTTDKGAFYLSVPEDDYYREMYPVSKMWRAHHELGDTLIKGLRNSDIKIYNDGTMPMDLIQTSYSLIPSVDVELGDKMTDTSLENLDFLADGLLKGILLYYDSKVGSNITNDNRIEEEAIPSIKSNYLGYIVILIISLVLAILILIRILMRKKRK